MRPHRSQVPGSRPLLQTYLTLYKLHFHHLGNRGHATVTTPTSQSCVVISWDTICRDVFATPEIPLFVCLHDVCRLTLLLNFLILFLFLPSFLQQEVQTWEAARHTALLSLRAHPRWASPTHRANSPAGSPEHVDPFSSAPIIGYGLLK